MQSESSSIGLDDIDDVDNMFTESDKNGVLSLNDEVVSNIKDNNSEEVDFWSSL